MARLQLFAKSSLSRYFKDDDVNPSSIFFSFAFLLNYFSADHYELSIRISVILLAQHYKDEFRTLLHGHRYIAMFYVIYKKVSRIV